MDETPLRFYWEGDEAQAETLTVALRRDEIDAVLEERSAKPLLLLSVELFGDESPPRRERIALDWSRDDLERLAAQPGDTALALDADDLRRAFDEDVEGHGIGKAALAITSVVATLAGASTAAAVRIPEPPEAAQLAEEAASLPQLKRVRYRLVGVQQSPARPKPPPFSERRNP